MIIYDPPSGWMYGFPKAYRPLAGETLEQTLLRDGYPEKAINSIKGPDGELMGVRFLGTKEELDGLP